MLINGKISKIAEHGCNDEFNLKRTNPQCECRFQKKREK